MYCYWFQDPCSVSPCQNEAECVVDQALHGTSIVFVKTTGLVDYYSVLLLLIMYTYLLIQDPCSVSPCQNDAECVVDQALHGRFYCVCKDWWSGGLL